MQAGLKAGESLTGLDELLGGSDGALAQLRQAARRIERGAADHPLLAEALAALDRALIEASEAEDRIARAADALAFDPGAARAGRGAAVRHPRPRPQAPRRARCAGGAGRRRCASSSPRSRPAASGSPSSTAQLAAARETYAAAAEQLSQQRREAAARLDAAVAAELAPLKLDAARFRTAIVARRAGPVGHRPGRVRSLDQPRRAVRAADPDRVGRRAVALHPRAQGRAGRGGQRGDDDLRRGRPRRRRRGRQRDRRAARAARRAVAGAGRHPLAAGRGARLAPLPDREEPRRRAAPAPRVRKLDAEERREEIARMLSGASITEEARAQASRLLDAA